METVTPHLILKNGRFWTMKPDRSQAEAIAIAGSDIIAVGASKDVERLAAPGTRVIDLEGRVAVPGLADCHVHIANDALKANAVEIRDFYAPDITSVKHILRKVAERAAQIEPGRWIHAHGSPLQDARLAEHRLPTKAELDAAAPYNPCYATFGAHIAMANSLALKEAGIDRNTPDPPGGWITRDEAGEPTGHLRERAQRILFKLDNSRPTQLDDGIETLLKRAAARGITTVHEIVKSTKDIPAYIRLWEAGRLPVRVQMLVRIIEAELTAKSLLELGFRQPFGSDVLKIGGAKMSIDGGFTGRQAAFRGLDGLVRIEQGELDQTVRDCHRLGIRCCIHAIGDLAVDMALTAIEKAQAEKWLPDIRHRVEHMGNHLFTPERRKRAKKCGAVPVTNPAVYYFLGETGVEYVGPERNRDCYMVKTLQDEGFPIAFGSDASAYWPVDSIRDIAAMVTRRTLRGMVIEPQEAISFYDGVRAQTRDAAWLGFEENRAGVIAAGRIADVCVFDRDPDDCPADQLATLPVALTVCAGKVTHQQ